MLIQPTNRTGLTILHQNLTITAELVVLTEDLLTINCSTYIDKNEHVRFINPYFKGNAEIQHIAFEKGHFTYELKIIDIGFKPGMIINHAV